MIPYPSRFVVRNSSFAASLMEPSDLDNVHWVIAGAVFGFLLLAFVLLFPVYRFLNREEETSRSWTAGEIARRQPRGDGSPGPEPPKPEPPEPDPPEPEPPR